MSKKKNISREQFVNPSNAELLSSKAQGRKDFWKLSKPCLAGIHWIALAEYSQMSTHLTGFQSFYKFFASFRFV